MKKFIALILAMAMALSLAACGSGGNTSTDETSAAETTEAAETAAADETAAPEDDAEATETADDGEEKIFYYGTDANSTTFDPAADLQTNSGNFLVHAVGETLWTVDTEGNITYKLAESLEYTAESMTITLRQDVKFSNGDDMTAEDVLCTLNHVASSARTASMYAAMDLENAEMPDDYTLIIPMNSYDAALIDLMGNASNLILDSEVCTEDYDYSWLIGTGPYMLKGDGTTDKSGWEESVQYTLVRNPYYWGDEPYYDELDVLFYSEESTRYADFQSGKLDAIYLTEATYMNNLDSGAVSGASLIQIEENAVYGFEMAATDQTTGAMSDINVRKAFAHCLDITSMVESMGEGVYKVASSLVGEGCWAYEDLGIYEYDPEAAAAYLAEAGYSVDNPITIKVYCESTAWNSTMFEAAQAYCAEIGINLDLTGLADFATILPTLLAGEQDMTLSQGSNGSGNDPANLLQQFGPASDNCLLRVVDDELVQLFNEGSASDDQDERIEIYHQFMEKIYEDYLFVPAFVGTKNFGVKDEHTSFASAIDASNQVDPTLLTD